MLYAIKVDNTIVYIGQLKDTSDEAWRQDFYFMLYYWKTSEHKEVHMEHILPDTAEEDEEKVMNMLIAAIEPIGNMEKYRIPGREAWW